jgi:RIO kinase 1
MGKKKPEDYQDRYQDQFKKYKRVLKDADQFKTLDEVFDHQNLKFIYDLFKRNRITTVDHPISTGKEANVFLCSTPNNGEMVVLKIFRTSTATFNSYLPYLDGDPRFENIKRDRRGIIYAWALKEFKNLQRLHKAGVRVPEPIMNHRNLLLMSYIHLDDDAAPTLKKAIIEPKDMKVIAKEVVKFMKLSYSEAHLVHSDLSEYNILLSNDGPVIIDVGQAVVLDHPNSRDYLERDVHNLVKYFNGFDLDYDEKKLLAEITGE